MARRGRHVIPNGDKWNVSRAGAARASNTFDTRQEAIERATVIARNQRTELYVHGRDGRIRERSSFGGDASARDG